MILSTNMKKNVNKNGWGRESDFDSFSYGRAYSCAPRCAGFLMLLLAARQEVAKKRAKTFPLGTPLALPLFKDKKEKDIKYLCASLAMLPPRAADADSKKFCGFLKGIRPLSPLSWFVLCRMTKNEHKRRNRSARDAVAQYDRQKKKSWKL